VRKRQIYLGVAGLALAAIGLAALWLPISLGQHDVYGFPIKCGNGFKSDFGQVAESSDLTAKCGSALLTRRIWAIPLLTIGWLMEMAFLIYWVRAAPTQEAS
jgi:hypothetical protein